MPVIIVFVYDAGTSGAFVVSVAKTFGVSNTSAKITDIIFFIFHLFLSSGPFCFFCPFTINTAHNAKRLQKNFKKLKKIFGRNKNDVENHSYSAEIH